MPTDLLYSSGDDVESNTESGENLCKELPTDLLYSSDEDLLRQVRMVDEGSYSHYAHVVINGVPVEGIVDTGADITIIGRDLFAKIAAAARLRKKDFRKADKVPRSYDRKMFHLDGCIDLNISFEDKVLTTTVYLKMDAAEPLLLSEGVCRQLEIVTYHPAVGAKNPQKNRCEATISMVRVSLVQSLRLSPNQGW